MEADLGGDIGAVNQDLKIVFTRTTYFNDSLFRFAAQGIVGAFYSLSDSTDIQLAYRYRAFLGEQTTTLPSGICTLKEGNLNESAVMLSVRFFLEPPPPPRAPPPVKNYPVKTYIVFIDFN